MPSERWPNGGTRAWRKLRAEVIARDGGRCTHVEPAEEGAEPTFVQHDKAAAGRCEKTARLEVHHSKPGPAVDADLEDLYTVCKTHHPKADAKWAEDAKEAAARAAIAQLDVQQIDIRALMPAIWNANHVHKATMEKIANSIREFGVVENLVVRPHPEFPGKYEVLSGNHRLVIFKRLRFKKVACHILQVDDAHARLLAQTLNRTRGSDDPEKLAALMEDIQQAIPKAKIQDFLENVVSLPEGRRAMEKLLKFQREEAGVGYQFKPIHPMKLGQRLEACSHPRKLNKALELFAGRGQLTYWYARLFKKVVRVDLDNEGSPDHNMAAGEYLRTQFLEEAPFDLIDFDDEGSPHDELDIFFELIKTHRQPPFVLCVTDGLAHRLKLIRNVPTDLQKIYRWPEPIATGKHLYLRCPELLDHGIQERAREAGYLCETIAVDWKPGKSATFGSWVIGPEEDTRSPIEVDTEDPAATPETWGAWRLTPQEPPAKKGGVQAVRKPAKKPVKKET